MERMKYQVVFIGVTSDRWRMYPDKNHQPKKIEKVSDLKWDSRDIAQLYAVIKLAKMQSAAPATVVWHQFDIRDCADVA